MFDFNCSNSSRCFGNRLSISPAFWFSFSLAIPALFAPVVSAQVNGFGISDPALFDTVINVPEDRASISGGIGGSPSTVQLNVSDGGTVADNFQAQGNSEVNVSGGTVGVGFDLMGQNFIFGAPSELNISGGNFVGGFASLESSVCISGGTIAVGFSALESSVQISGGSIGPFLDLAFSDMRLVGSEFLLDGVPLVGLTDGMTFVVDDRDGILSAVLEDGSAYSVDLSSFLIFESTISVFQVSATPIVIKGDVDLSGTVDFEDIPAFIAVLQAGTFQAEADADCSTVVDFADIPAFIAILSGQ